MPTKTRHLSMWKNEPCLYLFIKEGSLLSDCGQIVNRKRKSAGSQDDSGGLVVICRVEGEAEWIERIVTLKKPRAKKTKVFASTAELTRRLDAFERAWDYRFDVLCRIIEQLMRPKVPKPRRRRRGHFTGLQD